MSIIKELTVRFSAELAYINQEISENLVKQPWFLAKARRLFIKNLQQRSQFRDIFFLLISQYINININININIINLAIIFTTLNLTINIHELVLDDKKILKNMPKHNEILILLGDYLHTQTLQKLAELNNLEILNIVNQSSQKINEGDALFREELNAATINFPQLFQYLYQKFSTLFETKILVLLKLQQITAEQELFLLEYSKNIGKLYILNKFTQKQNFLENLSKLPGFWEYLEIEKFKIISEFKIINKFKIIDKSKNLQNLAQWLID